MPRISQLPAITVPSNDDPLAIVDTSGAVTSKITRGDLLGGAPLPAGSVDTNALAQSAVTPEKRSGGFKLITHVFADSTGSQSITGVGFKPKAIIVGWGLPTTDTAAVMSAGRATDGSPITQSSESTFVAGAASRVTVTSTTQAFFRPNGAATANFAASVTSFNADGITVNVTTTDATASNRTFQVMFLG